jgi:hypothetical protein
MALGAFARVMRIPLVVVVVVAAAPMAELDRVEADEATESMLWRRVLMGIFDGACFRGGDLAVASTTTWGV